ncbi:DinB family protein [Hymenobacter sp. HMF4947]|uniref:DinB family protein n=1 Tax=Hymenobacter ginkgonis TaxID=2682976 RepID=A0A7K1TB29_9BACT|nr:DinB family protein [Hymenobacter ginkgonis]MVN75607.1 DinB family protein [Hymenobacter ginkgonis]
MEIRSLIAEVNSFLISTFAQVDAWFDQPAALRSYRPADQGWTIEEILLHIGLTNHFLLILIEKGTAKALLNTRGLNLATELAHYQFPREKLAAIGVLHAFSWVRPEHMEPRTAAQSLPATRQQLHEQLAQALSCLAQLPAGEGILHQTTMTVNSLGKINVYEYIYFLAQHAHRHLAQMQENAIEFAGAPTPN